MDRNADIEIPTEQGRRRWWIPDLLVLGLVVLFTLVGVIIALGHEIGRLIG